MVNINEFKIYCENIIANKSQSGNTITPAQFNIGAHQAQMNIFEEDRLVFIRSGESSDFMNTFLTNKILPVNPIGGVVKYPSDFQHLSAMRSYYNKKARPIEHVTNQSWGDVLASELMNGTMFFPKYTEFDGEFRVVPQKLGAVSLDYYREPVSPVWGYAIVNNVPAYDSATSTDFEFDRFAMERVALAYIEIVAQNIKDAELSAYVQQQKQTDTTIV